MNTSTPALSFPGHAVLLALFITGAPLALAQEMSHDHSMHAAAPMQPVVDHSAHHKQALSPGGYQRSVAHYTLPSLLLTDRTGMPTSITRLTDTDQPQVVNFIFTSCTTICPIMSSTFVQAQKQLGSDAKDIQWISVSIDPEYDTPQRLSAYAERFDAGENWHFLTGDVGDIIALQKAFAVYRGDKMNHAPTTFLRMGRNQPWLRLDGLTSGSELVHEYHQLAHNH